MPFLKIQCNMDIKHKKKHELLKKVSTLIAATLGKPESYVMAAIEEKCDMIFGGTDVAAVFMELKSINLPENETAALSHELCTFAETELGVSKDRVYIEFANAKGGMWGWNGGTF